MAAVDMRELAMEVLLSVTRDGEYSHIVLRNVLEKYQFLTKQERAFLTRITEGTLERMIEIDYIINQFSKVKVNKMKPVIPLYFADVGLSVEIYGQRAGTCCLQ